MAEHDAAGRGSFIAIERSMSERLLVRRRPIARVKKSNS